MSLLTLITVLVVAVGVLGPRGYGVALALGGVTAAGAAIVVGSTAVPTFYAVALGVPVALVAASAGRERGSRSTRVPLPPGTPLLLAFFGWCVVVTLGAPLVFDGQRIVVVSDGATSLVAGVLTGSNLAQTVYLLLSICVVVFLARSPHSGPHLLGLTVGTSTMLSFWRYLSINLGVPFPEGVLDNSPSFRFIETAAGGLERFRGILSEPAGVAVISLATIAYMLPRSLALRGPQRFGALAVAGIAAYMGIISTSATFVVAGLAAAGLILGTYLVRFLTLRVATSWTVVVLGCLVVVAGLFLLPVASDFVATTINDKVGSSSYDVRTSSDTASLGIFLDTYGVGVGLGSARSSSFFPTLLAGTGLIGSVLFLSSVALLLVRGGRVAAYRPVVWVLVTLMVVKATSGPDIADTSGLLWISLGLLSHAALRQAGTAAGRGEDLVPSGAVGAGPVPGSLSPPGVPGPRPTDLEPRSTE